MRQLAVFAALFTACAVGQWHSVPAVRPLSRSELASRDLTIADGGLHPALRQEFSQALAAEGFTIVAHPPYHEELEVTLNVVRTAEAAVAVATLRSDGFFVDEARAPLEGNDSTAAALARTLAVSQSMADFVRNSGTPQQKSLSGQ
jgi:N-formylglutamate amidohydrolase